MPDNDSITDKVSKSALALIIRQIIVFFISVAGGVFLARLLTAAEFGIYAIALFVFNFIKVFGDAGLAAGLIRSKTEPTQAEYASIYTLQQVLVISAVVLFWFISPWIVQQYELAEEYIWLLRLIALALAAISFMVVPQVQLERNLAFDKLAVIEVVQALAFNIVAVVLAFYGYGAFALGWGFLARSISGAVLANLIQPWAIALRFNWKIIKGPLKFGMAFQGVNFISTLNAAINPILIAMLFGMVSAGYVEWAIILAAYLQRPLVLLNRVLYPAYAKVRDNLMQLTRAVNYTYATGSFIFFALAGLLYGLAPEIVHIVYTDKWLPALPLLYVLIIAKAFIPMSIPTGALGYALGWANTILYLNIIKSLILWVTVIIFINIIDSFMAFGYAMLVSAAINLALYFLLKKKLPDISILKTQLLFAISAVTTAFTLAKIMDYFVVEEWFLLVIALIAGAAIYLICCCLLYLIYYTVTKDDLIVEALRFLYTNIMKRLR